MEIVLNRITIYALSKLEATTNEDPYKEKARKTSCSLTLWVIHSRPY